MEQDRYIRNLIESTKNRRVKHIQVSEQSEVANILFRNVKIIVDKKYREKSVKCKKHLGIVKAFKKNERLMLTACNGRAKAAAARAGASFLEKNISKCGKDASCRTVVKYHIDQLKQHAAYEERLSKEDEGKMSKK